MTLVSLKELLAKYGISRGTYHNLLNQGLLPHYAKRFGEPGKKGARYLYDAEVFDEAWQRHAERTKRGLGINARKRDEKGGRVDLFEKLVRSERIAFILENVPVMELELLVEYEARIAARRVELEVLGDDVLYRMTLELFRQGYMLRSKKLT